MLVLLALFGIAALMLAPLTRALTNRVFLVAALVPLGAFGHALVVGPGILSGGPLVERAAWVPQLQLTLDLVMDPLSWVMTLIVTGVGALFLLFVFWELTSVLSYLLIGHYQGRRASRGAALQALITTTLGGLVMLVGLVLLAQQAGSASIPVIIATAPEGALTTTAIILVLVGALSKSAILPFHFWLPGAMAAPT